MTEHAVFYYSAAAALAAGLAYRWLRARDGRESPAADSQIARFGENIKLRDLFWQKSIYYALMLHTILIVLLNLTAMHYL